MIIVKITGGLGNQMFQYALGKAFSLERGEDVIYDTSFYQSKRILSHDEKEKIYRRLALHHFNVDLNEEYFSSSIKRYWRWGINAIHKRLPFLAKITNYLVYDQSCPPKAPGYHPEIWDLHAKKLCLIGFWQSEKYFIKYRDIIIHEFQITTPQSKKNRDWSEKIMNCNSVSLHVRRGDYSQEWRLDIDYYNRAIEYISNKVENPVFFIFSDDLEWVKNNLEIPYEVHYMDQNSQAEAYEDMRLISQCKYNIIANSSFSWWGAWLNKNPKKIVVAPNRWTNGSGDELVLEEWVRL